MLSTVTQVEAVPPVKRCAICDLDTLFQILARSNKNLAQNDKTSASSHAPFLPGAVVAVRAAKLMPATGGAVVTIQIAAWTAEERSDNCRDTELLAVKQTRCTHFELSQFRPRRRCCRSVSG
jgi:hypothetical protein